MFVVNTVRRAALDLGQLVHALPVRAPHAGNAPPRMVASSRPAPTIAMDWSSAREVRLACRWEENPAQIAQGGEEPLPRRALFMRWYIAGAEVA